MSTTLKIRHISKPGDLRKIAPANLLAFLNPEKDFFESKNCPVPDDPLKIDYDRISEILGDPEGMSENFQKALFEINELANPDLFDLILDIVGQKPWAAELGQDTAPADLAFLVYLNDRELTDEIHAQDYITKPKSFQYFLSNGEADRTFRMPTDDVLAQFTAALNATFVQRKRGDTAKVILREQGDSVFFLVRRGEPFSRQAAIEDGKSTSVFFRPEKYDLLAYNSKVGELRMTARSKWIQRLYLECIGEFMFHDRDFFGPVSRFDLSPIRALGKDALQCSDFPQIENVTLREIQIYHGNALGQIEIRKANDLFASLEALDEGIPEDGELRRASFLIKLKDVSRARLLKIGTDNKEEVKNDQDRNLFDRWLRARGFIHEDSLGDD